MNSPRPKRYPPRMLRVLDCKQTSPHTRRIRFAPSTFEGLGPHCAAAHIKLFFPKPHQSVIVLPKLGPKGPIWPPPEQKPVVRTYSICEIDEQAQSLSVEFVLHDEPGPASDWARQARPDQQIGLAGPGPALPVLTPTERPLLLLGDLSARPAMEAILGAVETTRRGVGLCIVDSKEEILDLPTPERFDLRWSVGSVQKAAELVESGALNQLIALIDPTSPPYLWVAGEHRFVVQVRDYLRKLWSLAPRDFYAVPYWRHQQNEEQYHDLRHHVVDHLGS